MGARTLNGPLGTHVVGGTLVGRLAMSTTKSKTAFWTLPNHIIGHCIVYPGKTHDVKTFDKALGFIEVP